MSSQVSPWPPHPVRPRSHVRLSRSSTGSGRSPMCGGFRPPRGSPKLSEALQELYPQHKTFDDRMRNLIIDFSTNDEWLRDSSMVPLKVVFHMAPRPVHHEQPPQPTYGAAENLPMPPHSFTNQTAEMHEVTIESSIPPEGRGDLGNEFIIVNSDGRLPPTRSRRPMTAEQRDEIKQMHKQGACSKCKKKRKKCHPDHRRPHTRSSKLSSHILSTANSQHEIGEDNAWRPPRSFTTSKEGSVPSFRTNTTSNSASAAPFNQHQSEDVKLPAHRAQRAIGLSATEISSQDTNETFSPAALHARGFGTSADYEAVGGPISFQTSFFQSPGSNYGLRDSVFATRSSSENFQTEEGDLATEHGSGNVDLSFDTGGYNLIGFDVHPMG